MPVLERVFRPADQEAFARFSGDRNPMHMDPVAARRTQAGDCAVHGVHALLWGLDALAGAGLALGDAAALKVEFTRFIRLDAPVVAAIREATPARVQADLTQDGQRSVAIDLSFGPRAALAGAAPSAPAPPPASPIDADLDALAGSVGCLLPPADTPTLFPQAGAALGPGTITSIGLLSTLVGMVAPGLHSIFSGFQIAFGPTRLDAGLAYAVSRVDDRFRLVAIDVTGAGFAGGLRAFARLPPVAPPTLDAIAALVRPDEFAGRRALVIGGSRGLGAVTAKLIAAGGGQVTLSYLRGRDEADAIAREIGGRFGEGRCRILRYDTAEDPGPQLAALSWPVTHAYYFATGRIFGPATAVTFDPAKLAAFTDVYVTAFHRLVEHLLAAAPAGDLAVFYPSSIAVEKRPKGLTEYAMAKAAGEILCADLAAAHRRLRIAAPRLPRIMTDQTATVPPVPAADPVTTMLDLLRAE